MTRFRLLALMVLAVAASASLAACGSDDEPERSAANEGIYVEAGSLKYQVQITRQLNPSQPMDRELLQGIAPAQRIKKPNELWYATFLRIENETSNTLTSASQFIVRDTNGEIFRPIPVNPAANSFAYVSGPILGGDSNPAATTYPNINSIPGQTDINGKMLLFKFPLGALALRPLTLTIVNPGNTTLNARVKLDI
jgi:hypothetical protein